MTIRKHTFVLFDLFGTLVQHLGGLHLLDTLARRGLSLSNEASEWVAKGFLEAPVFCDRGIDMQEALSICLCESLRSVHDVSARSDTHWRNAPPASLTALTLTEAVIEAAVVQSELTPGVFEVFRGLIDAGVELRLLSNTTACSARVLTSLGITPWLSACFLSCHTGDLKPHPSAFINAVTDIKDLASDIFMVGDNWISDVIGAIRADIGIRPVFYDPSGSHACRRLLSDIAPLLTVDQHGSVRWRGELRSDILPVSLEAIENDPLRHLLVDAMGNVCLSSLEGVRVVTALSELIQIVNLPQRPSPPTASKHMN